MKLSQSRPERARRSRRIRRFIAAFFAFVLAGTLVSTPAAAVTDPDPSFRLTAHDLEFILKQIHVSEAHSAGGTLLCDDPTDKSGKCVPSPALPFGLRTVDGSFNNLLAGQEEYGSADRAFPRHLGTTWREADPGPPFSPPNPPGATDMCTAGTTCYSMFAPGSFVYDADPRIISNLIVDQSADNPAAVNAAESTEGGEVRPDGSVYVPNTAPDEGLSAPFNAWFTFFGQFFDHGLDLVNKGGNGTLVVPLQPDDPLYDPASRTNFLVLTRATRLPGPDGVVGTDDDQHNNQTTPWVDQNQTYTSHPAHQVFLREYELRDGVPHDTGRLLDGTLPGGGTGGLTTWADVKRQANEVLGIELTDADVLNVPQVAVDLYGNFIPGPGGFPLLVTDEDGDPATEDPLNVEGSLADPVATTNALGTAHAFLDDIAHGSTPLFDADGNLVPQQFDEEGSPIPPGIPLFNADGSPVTDLSLAGYDNVSLDEHFVIGDGRGNENIGLTAVHHVFHAEHNRLVGYIDGVLAENPELQKAYQGLEHQWPTKRSGDELPGPEADDWSYEQRLFQAARFATEMQYQHLVFEEFARKVQPNVDPIVFNENSYDATIDPAVPAEFAHVVYRFGHSMLTEEIDREGFGTEGVSLLDGFLNPRTYDDDGTLTPEQAAGAVINGTTNQVAGQIDEHVIGTLRNNLLGLPLDLATINMLRGRDTGTPGLQEARRTFFASTGSPTLEPYESWHDFGLGLKNGNNFGRGGSNASLINFVAAYGTHPTILAEPTVEGKRDAASLLVNGTLQGEEVTFRIGGSDRFETAAQISAGFFQPAVPVAYVTSGMNFPDALSGASAAASQGGPVLLVQPGSIPHATAAELARLKPQRIVVLGGEGAVSQTVLSGLGTYTEGAVTRVFGADRYETAAAVSRSAFPVGVDVAYVASGENFPDALAGAAVAARDGAPILLVTQSSVPASIRAELDRLDPGRIVVLGGTGVISPSVQTQLASYTAGGVTRLGGADRYQTALLISQYAYPSGAPAGFVAAGTNFPDALAAAPVAGLSGGPLLLAPPTGVPAGVLAEVTRLAPDRITVLGGTGVMSPAIQAQLTPPPPTPADLPADRLDFVHGTGAWANQPDGLTTTGLEDVDFWTGGLAEALDPFGGMLGSTFNFVFEKQLENLQFGDRFYYLFRNQGNQLFAALEANSFSKLIQRNTDASLLPADIFSVPDPSLDLENLPDPWPEQLSQMSDGTYRWDGDEHVEIHGNRTEADRIRGGQGDDALWGYGGNDRIEGGSGNDEIIGGPGDDILTDSFGDDNIKGGLGNDAINGGPGVNLLLGSHGHDFMVGGSDTPNDIFSGTGNDVVLGGAGRTNVFGGEGDDWSQGGLHADLAQGDNANQFQNDTIGGNDVVVGGPGNDDIEGEGGDDVLVGRAFGTDRHEGAIGYDWVTYYGENSGVDADLRFTTLQRPDVQAVRDRYDLVEALSGGGGNDVLRGQGFGVDDIPENEVPLHKMTQETLDLFPGLEEILRPGGGHEDYALRFMDDPLAADQDGQSNLLIGGPGSDLVEGRGGNDFIDGDAYLRVQLAVGDERFDHASQLQARVFSGEINPGDITIVREIVEDDEADGVVDTAVYQFDREAYEVTDLGDGYTAVEHTGAAELEESDGRDVLRNVEMLQFGDGCLVLATMEACASFGTVTFAGQIDPPTEDLPLTATVVFDGSLVQNPTNVRFAWQLGEGGEEWEPSATGDTLPDAPNGRVDTFTPGDGDGGMLLRVVVTFRDDQGQLRSIVSDALPAVVNVNDVPTQPVLSPEVVAVGSGLNLGGFTDGDGLEESSEAGITYTWQASTDGFATVRVLENVVPTAYQVTAAEAGHQIRVVIGYTDDQGTAETVISTVSTVTGGP